HEAEYLASLKGNASSIAAFDRSATCSDTLAAIRDGADVIYQAYLEKDYFGGYSDFLKRTPDGGTYEVWDTKLSRHVKPEYLIQLCAYVDMLESMTGVRASTAGVILGDGTEARFHVPEYFDYYCYKRDEFLAFMAGCDAGNPCPDPEIGADHGQWSKAAEQRWLAADNLVQVANITRRQISRLEAAGITTLEALATARKRRVAGIDERRLNRLCRQAALQHATHLTRQKDPQSLPAWEMLDASECRPGLGFAALPSAVPEGDVYFDIEGDPMQEQRLEYLLGATYLEAGERQFRAFWAHTFNEERESFRQFMTWVLERRSRHPDMHIYHYAPYENAALKALASRHDLFIDEVDTLLRDGALVDLYSVVRNAIRIGEPNYSLKSVEHLYLPPRVGEVTTAGDSIVQYDRYQQLCDAPDDQCRSDAARILSEIEDYNRQDCDSTADLAKWLWDHRAEAPVAAESKAAPVADEGEAPRSERAQRSADLKQALREMAPVLRTRAEETGDAVCAVLADVMNYHEREDKPVWWRYFALKEADLDELRDAGDALVDAQFEKSKPAAGAKSRSQIVTFTFPEEQECDLKVGDRLEVLEWQDDEGWGADGEITSLDRTGRVQLKIANKKLEARVVPTELPPVTLIEKPETYRKDDFRERLLELGQAALAGEPVPPALRHFVECRKPPVSNVTPGVVTEKGIDPDVVAQRLAGESDFALCVQGPPGTGKTRNFGRVAARLIEAGKRVAVVAGSHEVMRNFVRAVGEAGTDLGWRPDDPPLFCQAKGRDANELEDA
ncbi:MAG TPA: TM0106 family RecB-like putative nuclease, partial [Acidobacteriaceae bacterium]|nr:TM0106 family RecB-like putative nuclease [Acidobacteriaceae bacterium]